MSRLAPAAMIALCACVALCACATKAPAPDRASETGMDGAEAAAKDRQTTLGQVVRAFGERGPGGIVLTLGTERLAVPPVAFEGKSHEELARRLAEETRCMVGAFNGYSLIYPPGYDALTQVSLPGALDPALEDVEAVAAFGAGTPLFTAFAILSRTTGVAVVAGNIVAEARCGELALPELPLRDTLQALLQSSRVRPRAFLVDSTSEYVFIYSTANQSHRPLLMNADVLDAASAALLDARVTVSLPEAQPEYGFEAYAGARPLGDVLGALSGQIGAPVDVEAGLEELPVNPAVLPAVRVRTALELLIRQWPVAEFGYTVEDGRITIRLLRDVAGGR